MDEIERYQQLLATGIFREKPHQFVGRPEMISGGTQETQGLGPRLGSSDPPENWVAGLTSKI
jgi:hypothetical protein